jgi:hypothetical protein
MKPEDITIKPIGSNTHTAYIMASEKNIGTVLRDDADGLWYLHGLSITGYMQAWVLRAIADRLDEMNKDWNEELDAAYKALPDEEESFDS